MGCILVLCMHMRTIPVRVVSQTLTLFSLSAITACVPWSWPWLTVRAVVVRVNSPGGSALASDSIYHELQRLRAAGKPVVVRCVCIARVFAAGVR